MLLILEALATEKEGLDVLVEAGNVVRRGSESFSDRLMRQDLSFWSSLPS